MVNVGARPLDDTDVAVGWSSGPICDTGESPRLTWRRARSSATLSRPLLLVALVVGCRGGDARRFGPITAPPCSSKSCAPAGSHVSDAARVRRHDGPDFAHSAVVSRAFWPGWCCFSACFCYATGNHRGSTGASAIGGPFKLIDQNGKPITDAGPQGPAVPGVLRLHALPRHLPDHASSKCPKSCARSARTLTGPARYSSPSIRNATRRR